MNENTEALDLAQLRGDGDTLELADGRMLRLKIEVDQDASINDSDVYGHVEQYSHDYIRDGHAERPNDFTGNAEKIQTDRGSWIWWEPPADGPKRGTLGFGNFRRQVRDLLEMGFSGVTLELCSGTDAYGRPIVINVASLWGIDSFEGGYLFEVVAELAAEVLA